MCFAGIGDQQYQLLLEFLHTLLFALAEDPQLLVVCVRQGVQEIHDAVVLQRVGSKRKPRLRIAHELLDHLAVATHVLEAGGSAIGNFYGRSVELRVHRYIRLQLLWHRRCTCKRIDERFEQKFARGRRPQFALDAAGLVRIVTA